jgi:hypothetical protein
MFHVEHSKLLSCSITFLHSRAAVFAGRRKSCNRSWLGGFVLHNRMLPGRELKITEDHRTLLKIVEGS